MTNSTSNHGKRTSDVYIDTLYDQTEAELLRTPIVSEGELLVRVQRILGCGPIYWDDETNCYCTLDEVSGMEQPVAHSSWELEYTLYSTNQPIL